MCRYGFHHYREHYACFDCRKSFKERDGHVPRSLPKQPTLPRQVPCPDCGRAMTAMGLDFKAPRRRDRKQWIKVKALAEHGFTYSSCGCGGPGYRPARLNQLGSFFLNQPPRSPGEALLREFARRTPRPA